jgi:hypothetical protein
MLRSIRLADEDHASREPILFREQRIMTSGSISDSKLAANRANAQLSTGPKTAEGKATASLNAVKTALTGRTVLLPTDDAAEYERHIRAYQDELNPVGQRESDLVKDCANCAIASLPTAGGSSLTRSDPSWE